MKILIDMNVSLRMVDFYSTKGIESVHWSTVGPPDATDASILEHAARHGYTVLTRDLDFGYLLATLGSSGPSIILLRMQDVRPGSVGEALVAMIQKFQKEIDAGAVLAIGEELTRVRLLPFTR